MRMLSETAAVALDLIVTFIICTGLLAAPSIDASAAFRQDAEKQGHRPGF